MKNKIGFIKHFAKDKKCDVTFFFFLISQFPTGKLQFD